MNRDEKGALIIIIICNAMFWHALEYGSLPFTALITVIWVAAMLIFVKAGGER